LLVGEHRVDGEACGGRQVEREDAFILERYDAFARTELGDELGIIAGQRAFPAEGVDAVGEACGALLLEAPDPSDARLAGAAHFNAKRLANSLASAS
jgi:hypothetical protein